MSYKATRNLPPPQPRKQGETKREYKERIRQWTAQNLYRRRNFLLKVIERGEIALDPLSDEVTIEQRIEFLKTGQSSITQALNAFGMLFEMSGMKVEKIAMTDPDGEAVEKPDLNAIRALAQTYLEEDLEPARRRN